MRGAKRKRTKHYPFHRSSPSKLPRPSSSHSRASLSRGRSWRPQLILPISGGRGSSAPSPGAALRRRRGTRGLVAGVRVQLFIAVAGAPRRQRGRRLVAGGRPIWTPRGGVSQLGWAVSSRLGRNVSVREFPAQIRRDTRTRCGYVSRPYPGRIAYVSDTGYAPSLPYRVSELQHDDDAAGVGVRAEAPHQLRARARRVHGELGPHGGRRERGPDVAGVEAQVEAHALGEQLRQRHRLGIDVTIE